MHMSQVRVLNPRRIYALRLRAGLSQEDLAHKLRANGLKTTAKSVARWEKGSHTPRADVVPALADALEVGVGELYTLKDADEDDELSSEALSRDLHAVIGRIVDAKVQSLGVKA